MNLKKSTYTTRNGLEFSVEFERVRDLHEFPTEATFRDEKKVTILTSKGHPAFTFKESSPETIKMIGEDLVEISTFVEGL